MKNNNRFLKLKEVMNITGIARSTIYFWMKQRLFPTPIKLGERSIGWLEADIESWMDERIAESSNAKKDVHPLDINPLKELEDNVKQKSEEQTLVLNADRWRGNNERLALIGIASSYDLIYGECNDDE